MKAYFSEYWITYTLGTYSDGMGYQRSYGWTAKTAWKDFYRRMRLNEI